MKQRIRVVALIRNTEGVLVLKRSRSRSEAPVFWELPTSKIRFGEQPEEAITRALSEDVGLSVESIRIKDVITFLALEGASRLSNLYIIYEVAALGKPRLGSSRYTSYKYIKDPTTSNVRLDEASLSALEITEDKIYTNHSSARDTASAACVYVDGASRGNPGPSGVGYQIIDPSGRVLAQGGEFIGFATSRMAEYYAMKNGIERALELGLKSAKFISDNLMVVNQLNGIFTIKNRDILPVYDSIQKLLSEFDAVSFIHVSRSENTIADHEANLAIDKLIKK